MLPRTHNQTRLKVATLDIGRGGDTCRKETGATTTFLPQGGEKEGRADRQGGHRKKAPGVSLPHPQRWQDLPGSGKGG